MVCVDLVAGQLAAFAGLGALRHLDLHHVGIDEIFRGDAEAAGGDLLDRRAHRNRRSGSGLKRSASSPPSPVFDLPPMRFMAMASVVCASREIEPKDIAPVAKRLTIVLGRLDLVERHRRAAVLFRRLDAEQAADGQQLRSPARSTMLARRPVLVLRIAAHGMLQVATDLARSRHAPRRAMRNGIFAADIERVAVDRRVAEGVAMAAHGFFGDLVEADAFDARRGAGEILLRRNRS